MAPTSKAKPAHKAKAGAGSKAKQEALGSNTSPGPSATSLKEASEQNHQQFCKSKRTRDAYATYTQQGKVFLASLVAERLQNQSGVDTTMRDNGINTKVLSKAFDNPPNEHSVDALKMFLSQKCFKDGLGRSTAEGIQAAFADYWDNM